MKALYGPFPMTRHDGRVVSEGEFFAMQRDRLLLAARSHRERHPDHRAGLAAIVRNVRWCHHQTLRVARQYRHGARQLDLFGGEM